jgi:uncharacterized protein (UPF0332 family)
MADDLHARVTAAFRRARDKLVVAARVLDAGFPADSVSPAYYACFHAAEAALAVEGDAPRTHEGLKSLFGLRFVQSGRLPAQLASTLRALKDERENGDYSVFPAITEEDAQSAIADAVAFVAAVAAFLEGQGFVTRD